MLYMIRCLTMRIEIDFIDKLHSSFKDTLCVCKGENINRMIG